MHHALRCFVEHRPHHLIATARYFAAPIDLARLIPGAGQPKNRPDGLGFAEAGWHIDGGAIGQRHHGADTRGCHQAPAYLILPDDSQQAAVQDDDLFTEHPPDDEQRLHQYRQVEDILDKLLDAGLEPHLANHSDLEAEVAQSTSQIVLDGDGLRLQKLAMGQQHSQFLAAERLYMYRTVQSHPDHLSDAARIVAVGLVDLRLLHRLHVPRLDTDHW